MPHKSVEVIRDTMPEKREDYPEIAYWKKKVQLAEKGRRSEFAKSGKASTRSGPKDKNNNDNVSFWHLQHPDGTVLNKDEVRINPVQVQENMAGVMQ